MHKIYIEQFLLHIIVQLKRMAHGHNIKKVKETGSYSVFILLIVKEHMQEKTRNTTN